MDLRILDRIKDLKRRLSYLRRQKNDATNRIGIEAIEQELARTAAQLPREWDLAWSQATLGGEPGEATLKEEARFNEDGLGGSPW